MRILYNPGDLTGTLYAYDSSSYSAIFRGASSSDCLGQSLANAGDTNADGFDELLVGSFQTGSKAGAAYLLSGTP